MDYEKIIDTLLVLLASDPSPLVRAKIAVSLGNVVSFQTKILNFLDIALVKEEDEYVRISIVESICKLVEYHPQNNMSESPKFAFYNSNVGNLADIVQHDQNAYQYIRTNDSSELDSLMKNLQSVLNHLKQENSVNSSEEAQNIITVEFTEIKKSKSWQWQNLLKLKHYINGSKQAAIEVGKYFMEDNIWGKGFIAFLEGFSEEI